MPGDWGRRQAVISAQGGEEPAGVVVGAQQYLDPLSTFRVTGTRAVEPGGTFGRVGMVEGGDEQVAVSHG